MEFAASKDEWISYANGYFVANDIDDAAKKCVVLISACGPATYRVITDVLTPDAPNAVAFDTIVEKMTKHFQPAPNEIVLQVYQSGAPSARIHC